VLQDPVFDFAEGLNAAERAAVARILARRPQDTSAALLDQLTLIAASVQPPVPAGDWDRFMADFAARGDALLRLLSTTGARPLRTQAHRTGDFATVDAARALADFAAIFPPATVPWYVISGTFLGLIREGGFLAHDYDIDLGIHAEDADLPEIVSAIARSRDFFLHKSDVQQTFHRGLDGTVLSDARPILYKIVHRSGLHIDLFVHYLDDGQRWHGSNVHRWTNHAFALAPYQLAGVAVLGPADADRYLTENYGDWRTPRTDFNPSTGTPNLAMVHNLASFVLFLRRYALAVESGDAAAGQLAEIMVADRYLLDTPGGLRVNKGCF
jgi:hypothetical protein